MNTAEIFEKISRERIMIVGDVMIDSYMWGDVTRISPEAPVPVVSITKREKRLGGAANVALNISSMGATPIICSVLGNDDRGKDFQQIMYDNNMDRRGIVTSDNRMTTVKSRVIGNNMHIAYSPGGGLIAFALSPTVCRRQQVLIVYCVDYQGICQPHSQAPFCLCTLRTVTKRAEGTFESLRYSFGGDHPSQTTHHRGFD